MLSTAITEMMLFTNPIFVKEFFYFSKIRLSCITFKAKKIPEREPDLKITDTWLNLAELNLRIAGCIKYTILSY